MRKDREVKITDLSPPLHFLEQLSHPGKENVLQHRKRPGIGWSPSTSGGCFHSAGCTAGYHSRPQKVGFSVN